MKKLLFIFMGLLLLAMTPLAASEPIRFQKDEDGEYYLDSAFNFNCKKETAWKRLSNYIESIYNTETGSVSVNEETRTITVKGGKENLALEDSNNFDFKNIVYFTLTLNVLENRVNCRYSNLVSEVYAKGSLIKTTENKETFRVLLRDYDKAVIIMNDSSSSKQDIAWAKKEMKKTEPFLSLAQEKLLARIESLRLSTE